MRSINILPNAIHYCKRVTSGFVETPSDDCWCETHKNDTLLLAAVKLTLRKLGKTEFATALFEHPIELMNYSVCTVKDFR